MKRKKLMQRLQELLDAGERARKKQMSSMHQVLDALKEKERRLKARAKLEKNPGVKENLENTRKVVHAQRKKGLIALKALQKTVSVKRKTDSVDVGPS